jgi:hypothetical protein
MASSQQKRIQEKLLSSACFVTAAKRDSRQQTHRLQGALHIFPKSGINIAFFTG